MTLAVGGGAVPFVTAYSEFGVDQNFPHARWCRDNRSVGAASHGQASTVLGTISHGHWAEGADIPETQAVRRADFEEATGKIASYYAAANYAAMQWIVATLGRNGRCSSPPISSSTR